MKLLDRFALVLTLIVAASCGRSSDAPVGVRIEALDDSAWTASEWISAADAPVVTEKIKDGSRAADGASWFVSDVKNSKKLVSAKWMTAGLGVYELYVNGRPVGEEILKPGFTDYRKTKRSFTYDVTAAFDRRAGAVNQLYAQLTPGWWADKIVTKSGSMGMAGKKCAFRSVLELVYSDGTSEILGTDTSDWKAGIAGPVKHAAIFDGEVYDARVLPGYETVELLGTPEVNEEFKGEILPSDGAEVYLRQDLAMTAELAYVWEGVTAADEEAYGKVSISRSYKAGQTIVLNPGETLVLDFAQNCSAVPAFEFKAAEGTVLHCEFSEMLNDGNGRKSRGMDGPEGSAHRLNLRIPNEGMWMEYCFAGKGWEKFSPRCTFFGYRIISLRADAKVTIRKVLSVPVTSIAENLETGKISTGNELVNKLISNTYWGELSNYLSVPTDCPQRNERLGWTADTQVFSETGTFFADTRLFFHKWMRDMRDAQGELGGFPGVAPYAQYGNENCRLGWSDAGIIVPWTVWKQFGDNEIVEENWASMEKYMNLLAQTRYDHNALVSENGNYQWADWLSYEPLESCGGSAFVSRRDPYPETIEYWNFLSASYWALDASMMRDMAAATGRDAARYESMASEAKTYIRNRFLNEKGEFNVQILNTMQTPALFLLKNGILEGEALAMTCDRLRRNFAEHGDCLQTGFLGTSILMDVLTDNGMSDLAYSLLYQRKNPSWLYSVDNGATTIWERWNSYMLESGMGPKGMNSFNHYAYGCVCGWLWKTAAGIAADPTDPGFRTIIMKPVPDKGLVRLDAEYRSAAGLIRSSWKYEGDEWIWNFTVPEGARALVTAPGDSVAEEYAPGSYVINRSVKGE